MIYHQGSIKNVDIKFSAYEAFLEYHSSDTLKIERLENQLTFGSNKTNNPKQYSQNRLRSHMNEGGEP